MSLLNKILNKLGYVKLETVQAEKTNLIKQLHSLGDLYQKSQAEINKCEQVICELEKKVKLETGNANTHFEDLVNLRKKHSVVQQQEKDLKRKNNRLLTKQKQFKEKLKNLEDKYQRTSDELNLLRKELEGLGISEPKDITELQALNRKLRKSVALMAQYQSMLEQTIDMYRYGYSFAYIESIHPRTVVEMPLKRLKTNKD